MARLLTLLMMITLVISHGSAGAAAICHHQSQHQHAVALSSHDAGVAAAAIVEDAAADFVSGKASHSVAGHVHVAADMVPAPRLSASYHSAESPRLRPLPQAPLASLTMRPLLQPPLG